MGQSAFYGRKYELAQARAARVAARSRVVNARVKALENTLRNINAQARSAAGRSGL
jgi:hypothetical protein